MAECLRAGANLVGGCCGTTAEHICSVANILDEK
ncbi:MAG: homocysteine S-methyltransferase family protein [Planctomycetota bacterium]